MLFCALLWLTLAVTAAVRNEMLSLKGEHVILRCEASTEPGVRYRSVIWYKVSAEYEKSSRLLTGLVMKKLIGNNSRVETFKGVTRHIEFLENSTDLFLPNVTSEDSGIYSCFLSAPLGQQNREGDVHLNVHDDKKVGKKEFYNYHTLNIVALTVLGIALLVMFTSYVCLRNVSQNNKKASKDLFWKVSHQGKQLIYPLVSKDLICKTVPDMFV